LIEYFNKRSDRLYHPKSTAYYVSTSRALRRIKEDLERSGAKGCIHTLLGIVNKMVKGRPFIAEAHTHTLRYLPISILWRIKRLKHSSRVSKIFNNIYLGPAADNTKILSFITSSNIECIIDLREKHELKHLNTLNLITNNCYFNVPIKDDSVPKDEDFIGIMSIMDKLIKERRKIYINCRLGRGRSPTILLAYLACRFKKPIPYLYLLIAFRRPSIKLTEEQMKFLYSIDNFNDCILE